jgi:hypothetical protein
MGVIMKKSPAYEKQTIPLQDTERTGIRWTLKQVLPVIGGWAGDKRRKAVFSLITLAIFLGVCVGVILLVIGGGEDRVSLTPEDICVVKISPQDQSAVVKTSGGALHLIRVGDSPKGLGRVVEIVEGRIVIAAQGEGGNEEIIIRVEDGNQRIVRIRQVGDAEPLFSTSQPIK